MKLSGDKQPKVRMAPAHQRLEACEVHVGQPCDRLVMNLDLVPLDGAAEFGFEHHEFGALILHGRNEEFDRLGAAALGLVKGYCRILHQLLGGEARFAHVRDADRGGEEEFLVVELDRTGHGLDQGLGEAADVALVGDLVEEDRELVARHPRNRVGWPTSALSLRPMTARSASPASWPMASFTILKRSRSISSTKMPEGPSSAASSARARRSMKSARLGRPVTTS
jgi:hypothetical protein